MITIHINVNDISLIDLILQNQLCRKCFYIFLDISLQRSCTINRIISLIDNELLCCIGKLYGELPVCQTLIQIGDDQFDNTTNIILRQRLEQDRFIQTV